MAKNFIDGKTDEDWALANNTSVESSPPRFAKMRHSPRHQEESSVLVSHSINDGFPPFGGGTFHRQQSSLANVSASVSIAPSNRLQAGPAPPNNTNFDAVSTHSNFHGLMSAQTDEVVKLKKQLRQKESEFAKDKAVLEQRSQQLELSLKDAQMRMEQQKSMHDQMVRCLREQGSAASIDVTKSISDATQSAMVLRLENELAAQRLEQTDRETGQARQIEESQKQVSDLQKQNEKLSLEVKDLEWQLNQLKEKSQEQTRTIERANSDAKQQAEASKHASDLDQEKLLRKLQQEHESNVRELKQMHEQSLKDSLKRVYAENETTIKELQQRNEQMEEALAQHERKADQMANYHRENLSHEMVKLHQELTLIQTEMRAKEEKLRQERDQAQLKAKKALKKLEKLQGAPKRTEMTNKSIDCEAVVQQNQAMRHQFRAEIDLLAEENTKLKETCKRVRNEKQEAEEIADQLEQKARALVKEKYRIQDEKDDFERKLHSAQRRLKDQDETLRGLKSTVELQQNSLLERDHKLNNLKRELRETERKRAQLDNTFNSGGGYHLGGNDRSMSPFSTNNFGARRNTSPYPETPLVSGPVQGGAEGPSGGTSIQQMELTQLRVTQRMVECATRMECAFCLELCRPDSFYQHLLDKHSQQMNRAVPTYQLQPSAHQSYSRQQCFADQGQNLLNQTLPCPLKPMKTPHQKQRSQRNSPPVAPSQSHQMASHHQQQLLHTLTPQNLLNLTQQQQRSYSTIETQNSVTQASISAAPYQHIQSYQQLYQENLGSLAGAVSGGNGPQGLQPKHNQSHAASLQ